MDYKAQLHTIQQECSALRQAIDSSDDVLLKCALQKELFAKEDVELQLKLMILNSPKLS